MCILKVIVREKAPKCDSGTRLYLYWHHIVAVVVVVIVIFVGDIGAGERKVFFRHASSEKKHCECEVCV